MAIEKRVIRERERVGDLRRGDRVRQFKSKLRKTVTGPMGRILWFAEGDKERWHALVGFEPEDGGRVDKYVDVELLRKEASFPVTDPHIDAPDGVEIDGMKRVGDRWEPIKADVEDGERNEDGDVATCDCGGELRFDPDMVGDTCGGLTRIGWNVCVKCGKGWLAKAGKSYEKWKLSSGGRSVETGIGRIRVDGAVDAEKLMARIVKLPELELEVARLRAALGGWDGKHEMGNGLWYHFKRETVSSYENEIDTLKKEVAKLRRRILRQAARRKAR